MMVGVGGVFSNRCGCPAGLGWTGDLNPQSHPRLEMPAFAQYLRLTQPLSLRLMAEQRAQPGQRACLVWPRSSGPE